ncbi:unnamed protein product [Scytosiphon promiscuus]
MNVRVSVKKALGQAAGVLTSKGGVSAVRPASMGAMTALQPTAAAGDCCLSQQQQTRSFFSKERSKSVYEYGAHRSDAEARIAEVPVVMVEGSVALCDGGGGALGHPLDYVQLASPDGGPRACQYCGIQYQMKAH